MRCLSLKDSDPTLTLLFLPMIISRITWVTPRLPSSDEMWSPSHQCEHPLPSILMVVISAIYLSLCFKVSFHNLWPSTIQHWLSRCLNMLHITWPTTNKHGKWTVCLSAFSFHLSHAVQESTIIKQPPPSLNMKGLHTSKCPQCVYVFAVVCLYWSQTYPHTHTKAVLTKFPKNSKDHQRRCNL